MSRPEGLRTWIEVDRKSLKYNYQTFRRLLKPSTKLMAVVKSNAYGHNLIEFSIELQKLGVDWFGVDSIVEAVALRKNGIKKTILVLGYTLPEKLPEVAQQQISLTVSHREHLETLAALKGQRPKIHLKIDTGMHRQGFLPEDLSDIIKYIEKSIGGNSIEGVYTHFATGKDPDQPAETLKQGKIFDSVLTNLLTSGLHPLRHAAATAGTLLFPQFHYDLVRIGIGLYGHYPSEEIRQTLSPRIRLKPALIWKTIIGEIKELPKDTRVGYDLTERLRRRSRVAVCPVGYWHGFPRALSSQADVLVGGRRCKVMGRVSMDMICVDVTEVPEVKINDEVVLIGHQGEEKITAEELGKICGTTNYEILTRLNPLIQRIYL